MPPLLMSGPSCRLEKEEEERGHAPFLTASSSS